MSSGRAILKAKLPVIPGTKPSLRNSQLLISTGIPSLDNTIGGGLPIGSIFLIEEDKYGFNAKVVLKYFIAEGVVVSQPILIASQDTESSRFASNLPEFIGDSDYYAETTPHNTDEIPMKIAWRYQNMKTVNPIPQGQTFGHYYDLTKRMQPELLERADIKQWQYNEEMTVDKNNKFENAAYADLLYTIEKTLREGHYFISETPDEKKILRIAIHSVGSRLWLADTETGSNRDLLKFLYCFRSLLRNSFAVGVITVPVINFENAGTIIERIEHLSDIAIRLESFAGSPKEINPLFKEYHGLLHIKKLCALNGLSHGGVQYRDLAFKLRRKKFLIEVLHLPPEFEDTTQREQDEIEPSTIGCASGSHIKTFDF
ncbi:hypothetical protein P5V15_011860 [Pogonomyrmex californicus]